ncbi:serine/threonine-protein phosphatase [Candidatus Micrarchaeota archaeon]|nr:serine/threonine-protein phosphatase [Candidatus Micrarchaeota archaeon]
MEEKVRKATAFFNPHIPRFSKALSQQPHLLVALHNAVESRRVVDIPTLKEIGTRFLRRKQEEQQKIVEEMHNAWRRYGVRAAVNVARNKLTTIQLEVGGHTDIGKKRRKNEDSFHVDKGKGLFIVADGMGGHSDGEIASKMAVQVLTHDFDPANPDLLPQGIEAAHARVKREAVQRSSQMGTTLTALHISNSGSAHIAHVGDSRVYRLRNKLEQLTEDHTLVWEMVKIGAIKPEEASHHHLRNVLTKGIGSRHLDMVNPQVVKHDVQHNDVFLLCSDGLTNELSEPEIQRVLEKVRQGKMDAAKASKLFVKLANDNLGRDNITALVVKVKKD